MKQFTVIIKYRGGKSLRTIFADRKMQAFDKAINAIKREGLKDAYIKYLDEDRDNS